MKKKLSKNEIMAFAKKEIVFVISMLLAVISSFWVHPSIKYFHYPDYRVLALLFCLMLIVASLKAQGIFHFLGQKLTAKVKGRRQLELVLILLCFFSSMFITNDVALITFVPFTLELLPEVGAENKMIKVVALQTIAANLGSMLTPVGNPQNLYLYSVTGISLPKFLIWMLPLTAVSFILLCLATLLEKKASIQLSQENIEKTVSKKKIGLLMLLFLICMGTVIRIIPWQISFVIVLIVALLQFREHLFEIDYCLLGTFLGFFIFVGNMQNIPAVSNWIEEMLRNRELWVAAIASQVISNVPATMLLSGFTDDYRALLYGVDVGGLGTLIASLASLISYKFYCNTIHAKKGKYLLVFTSWNLFYLAILLPFAYCLLR